MVLGVVEDYADQFVAKGCTVPVVSDLFQTENLDLDYLALPRKRATLKLDISAEEIN